MSEATVPPAKTPTAKRTPSSPLEVSALLRTLEMIHASDQALIRAQSEAELLQSVCRIAVETGGYKLSWVGYAEDDPRKSVRAVAHSGAAAEYVAAVKASWADTERGRGPTGAAIREGRTMVARDFMAEARMAPWRAAAAKYGFRSSISIPLMADGRAFGALMIYSIRPDAFDQAERELLEELAGDLAYGVRSLRTRAAHERAEAEIRHSEARYRRLVGALNDGLVEVDGDYRITFANEAFARMLGVESATLPGRHTYDFLDEPNYQDVLRRTRDQGAQVSEQYEISWRRADGTFVPTLVSSRRVFDEAHRYQGSLSVITDLTELKRAQVAREQIARIVETAQDGIVGEDLDGRITSWNRGAEAMYGYAAVEMIGQTVDRLAPPEHRGEGQDLLRKILAGEPVEHFETERLAKDGRRLTVSITLSPIQDAAGRIVGISRVFRDVTRVRTAERAMRENEALLKLQIERMPIGHVTWDPQFRVRTWNPAAEKIFGFSAAEALGKHPYEFLVPNAARAAIDEIWARVRGGDETASSVNENLTKDGRTIVCNWINTPLKTPDGRVHGVMSMVEDMTARQLVEAETERQHLLLEELVAARTSELELANKDLEAFAYSVSHDLRAPLRAVDGFSQILIEDYGDKLDAEGQHVVSVIREGARKMAQMIDDILAFSRAGRLELKSETVDMRALAEAALADLQPALAGRGVKIEIGELPAAIGDPPMLQRVWQNLLDNAIKYTAPKSDARILLGAEAGDDETIYFVRDNGVGFDMAYVDKLFGVFQRLHGAEFPGTGIGLAIIKRIVARHGGRVWAQGKVGEGATFSFALPKGGPPHG